MTLRFNDATTTRESKKAVGLITPFCTFLCRFLHDYDVKIPNFVFNEERIQATTYFISLMILNMVPWNSNSGGTFDKVSKLE